MSTVNNIQLTHYAIEGLAMKFGMRSTSASATIKAAGNKALRDNAVIVEVAKDNPDRFEETETYRPFPVEHVQAQTKHENTKTTNSEALNDVQETIQSAEAFHKLDELDIKTIRHKRFLEFGAAWGTQEGQANYDASYDLDENGVIDIKDWFAFETDFANSFKKFGAAWGTQEGQSNYDASYDFDQNGSIDMKDWFAFCKSWFA